MKILIDGPDGAGKSTLATRLSDEFHCDILHMMKNGSKNYFDYWDKSFLKNVILDRSFFSEFVYSKVSDRPSQINRKRLDTLVNRYKFDKWKIIFLTAETSELLRRINRRGEEEEAIKRNLDALRLAYEELSLRYNIPLLDVGVVNEEEIIEMLRG